MHIAIVVLLLIVGLVLIIKGGDFFVDAASWMAEISGIPKIIVGATVVSVATTLPELLVSVMAAADGKVDMSIGNAVGSVTANLGLIMAISIICMPAIIKRKDIAFKGFLMIAVMALLVVSGLFFGMISIPVSVILMVCFVAFIIENFLDAKKAMGAANAKNEDIPKDKKTIITNIIKFVLGAVGIVVGANLLVNNGSELARIIGISERVIGVTLVAVGTSLPELVTTITAIIKKENSLSVGNILGANILDLTLIMPVSSLIAGKPLPISALSAAIDLPACLAACLLVVIPAFALKKFKRSQGVLILVLYCGYVALTCLI